VTFDVTVFPLAAFVLFHTFQRGIGLQSK